jgi:NADPH:quinone reductase-like Zn-dependent oxidoreductase
MKAIQLIAHGTPGQFKLVTVPSPVPAPGEVVVSVKACGLNHLDLWMEKGALPIATELPRIPGSEISGEIFSVGPHVTGWRPGDRIAVQSNLFCGNCDYCAEGRESLCLNGILLGVQRDGGFAERVSVPARALVPLPEGVDFHASAALSLSGSTAMHMLTERTTVRPGDWVLVIAGASGVGSAAVQIARQLGAYVIATGSTEIKRNLALALGAHHAIDSTSKEWPSEVRRLTGRRGVDLVVEHVGGETLMRAFHCLARGGTIVTCGATSGKLIELNLWPFFVKEQRLIGSYGRTRADLESTLQWAASGKLKPVIDAVLPLSAAVEGLRRLEARAVCGKLLIQP